MKHYTCPECKTTLDLYGDAKKGFSFFCSKCRYEFPSSDQKILSKDKLIQKFTNKKGES